MYSLLSIVPQNCMKNELYERSVVLNSKTPYKSKYVSQDSTLKKERKKIKGS